MTRYITLAEYVWLAEQVRGCRRRFSPRPAASTWRTRALHAPAAGFGDDDFYPDMYDKAAVLTCRLAWNHPLPDGNKRAAWASLLLFIDLNGGHWSPILPTSTSRGRHAGGGRG